MVEGYRFMEISLRGFQLSFQIIPELDNEGTF